VGSRFGLTHQIELLFGDIKPEDDSTLAIPRLAFLF